MPKKKVAIGIDLGTTYTVAGVVQDGNVKIIFNDMGNRITPSCVSFDDDEVYVGEAAKDLAATNPQNTVFEVKRLIGRKFNEATLQDDIKQWPFKVIDDCGAPKIRVQFRGEKKVFAPEEISAMVLQKVKKAAETFLGHKVTDAVITVPAYFNDSQRQATLDAGKIAGLNVLQIINEPTAAALAYGHLKKTVVEQTVLVFDLGGGTFDVSILTISGNDFEVRAVCGDTHLGGGDFDKRLQSEFLEIIKRKYNKDLSLNSRALGRLRKACETEKQSLSTREGVNFAVDGLIDGHDFQERLTRVKFQHLCMDLFQNTIKHVQSALDDAGMTKSNIDEVILVGGSSRVPKIQQLLREFFDGKELNSTINPDEAVAYGAAVKAALVSGEYTIEEISLADVVPLSLGQSRANGDMVTFIKRNTRYPITVVQEGWTTAYDYQDAATTYVYEGEHEIAEENNLLGTFTMNLDELELKGVPKFTDTFTVDENGILHVSSVNEKNGKSEGISITSNKGRLTKEEIERMVVEVKQLKVQ